MLELTRPLVVLDVETTGTSPKHDRIIQIGVVKLLPDMVRKEWSTYVNPGMPIPPEATVIHHITDAMVQGAPSFRALAPRFHQALRDCDIAGYNVNFDLSFIKAEFLRVDIAMQAGVLDGHIVDVFRIFSKMHPRTLTAAAQLYLGQDLEGAHDALIDTRATLDILMTQLEQHPELPHTMPELHSFCFERMENAVDSEGKFVWRYGEATLAFGAHQGVPLKNVPAQYLRWILANDFSPEVKGIVRNAVAGRYPRKEDTNG